MMSEFVPAEFEAPTQFETPLFRLEPLGPEHNERDYAAWTSSNEHIHATPGWGESRWPRPMTPDENLRDLQRHANDFSNRSGFTYTVLEPETDDVIGCVYIYPAKEPGAAAGAAQVHSWVRADRAELDAPLWRTVGEWLQAHWPFTRIEYAERESGG